MRRNASRSFDTCEETGVTNVVYLLLGNPDNFGLRLLKL
jgi:hypothetical protein